MDKPPFSFWVQSIPVAIFGIDKWSVSLPQAVAGTLAIGVLYMMIMPVFGRVAALVAVASLAVIPASVLVDSRNEPDSLLSFVLLTAAFSVVKAAQTGRWRWLIAFAVLVGIGFNIKMLVAFVPLPAFLIYYLLAARGPVLEVLLRAGAAVVVAAAAVAVAVAILTLVSFSWVTAVALTPKEERPYIGSTRDNSIWTLVFKYNGLNRFTSFAGPRQRPPAQQLSQYPQQGQTQLLPGYPVPPGGGQPFAPQPPATAVRIQGFLGCFPPPLPGSWVGSYPWGWWLF